MGTWSPGKIRLVFPEGHPQHGLEVVMRRQRIGEVLTDLTAGAPPSDEEFAAMSRDERAKYALERSQRNIEEFAGLVVSWNFAADETSEVLPVTADSVLLLDDGTFEALQDAYRAATRKVAPPLPQPSDGGEPSEEELTLPQEPL